MGICRRVGGVLNRCGLVLLCWMIFSQAFPASDNNHVKPLRVSRQNPHLLATENESPVFLNSFTVWKLLRNGSREDVEYLLTDLKRKKLNAISTIALDLELEELGKNYYGDYAFQFNEAGLPDPLQPIVTLGNDPQSPEEYDFWDHLDFVIAKANEMGMYVVLHPAWGDWFTGEYNGKPNRFIIFNEENAYKYGFWIGRRYSEARNIVWMVGGDRSAVYGKLDYRSVFSAMGRGIADGVKGGAGEKDPLISFHPRKWAPNSSEWFHDEPWLSFNSIQDTPYDQVTSVPNDYGLSPVKPTWLCEGRYEGPITDWGVRYQAWQTVLSGGFGHTYGSDAWQFPRDNWRQYLDLPGLTQMGYLYYAVREIWSDKQFLGRTPDQGLILGDQGETVGDGNTRGDGDGGGASASRKDGRSDRITAMRGDDGSWAMVYTAAGKEFRLDLGKLKGRLKAYWFNPATGKWWVDGVETADMRPFQKGIKAGKGDMTFDPPGNPGNENDWVLILRR